MAPNALSCSWSSSCHLDLCLNPRAHSHTRQAASIASAFALTRMHSIPTDRFHLRTFIEFKVLLYATCQHWCCQCQQTSGLWLAIIPTLGLCRTSVGGGRQNAFASGEPFHLRAETCLCWPINRTTGDGHFAKLTFVAKGNCDRKYTFWPSASHGCSQILTVAHGPGGGNRTKINYRSSDLYYFKFLLCSNNRRAREDALAKCTRIAVGIGLHFQCQLWVELYLSCQPRPSVAFD